MFLGFKINNIQNIQTAIDFIASKVLFLPKDLNKSILNPDYFYICPDVSFLDTIGKPFSLVLVEPLAGKNFVNISGHRLEVPFNVVNNEVKYTIVNDSELFTVNALAEVYLKEFLSRNLIKDITTLAEELNDYIDNDYINDYFE